MAAGTGSPAGLLGRRAECKVTAAADSSSCRTLAAPVGRRSMVSMDVELLVVPGCPHEGRTMTLVRRALDDVGLGRVPIRTRVVSGEDEAEHLRFVGSPTVRINGEDPFGDGSMPFAVACRVYITDGRRSGLPDPAKLRQALNCHAAAGRTT